MWSETTTIHPAAWSPLVESDLAKHIFGYAADVIPAEFEAACASAREQLATLDSPQHVTLKSDGTATVTPVDLGEV